MTGEGLVLRTELTRNDNINNNNTCSEGKHGVRPETIQGNILTISRFQY